MKTFLKILVATCLLIVAYQYNYTRLWGEWTIRHRLTLEVALGDTIFSGSAVKESWFAANRLEFGLARWSVSTRGQAVVVDLGARGILFAINGVGFGCGSEPDDVANVLCFINGFGPSDGSTLVKAEALLSAIAGRRDSVEVRLQHMPMLVRFRNLIDPNTIELVDRFDLAKSFGPEVRLQRVTLQLVPRGIWPFNQFGLGGPAWLVGEPLTTGIEKLIPWVVARQGSITDSKLPPTKRPIEQSLGGYDFYTRN